MENSHQKSKKIITNQNLDEKVLQFSFLIFHLAKQLVVVYENFYNNDQIYLLMMIQHDQKNTYNPTFLTTKKTKFFFSWVMISQKKFFRLFRILKNFFFFLFGWKLIFCVFYLWGKEEEKRREKRRFLPTSIATTNW